MNTIVSFIFIFECKTAILLYILCCLHGYLINTNILNYCELEYYWWDFIFTIYGINKALQIQPISEYLITHNSKDWLQECASYKAYDI